MAHKALIIGSGFAGLAAAIEMAHLGHEVHVFEKNADLGGRARKFEVDGFVFDMGPSWYWMPDVFENFFERYGKKVSDYYQLHRLDPSYRVYFEDGPMDIHASLEELKKSFEALEPGSAELFQRFLDEGQIKYEIGMNKFVQKPSHSIMEFAELSIAKDAIKLHILKSFKAYVAKYFKNDKIRQLLEFPVLFLGAKPDKTPAMYSLMNYADTVLGTWYPMGGMHEIVKGMVSLAKEKGVHFHAGAQVEQIIVENKEVCGLMVNGEKIFGDSVIAGADYHHVEQKLLAPEHRMYDEAYWDKRTMSPSSVLYYLGVKRKVSGLLHHNLFFDTDFGKHSEEIYDDQQWPEDPLFYVCAPSKTDPSVAPESMENIFILIPVAPDLAEEENTRSHYLKLVLDRLEEHTGERIHDDIIYERSFAHYEFKQEYNSYKGNAYGLANTLDQTAFLKPKLKSKKVSGLYFAGQLTTPGPGVPPSIISGVVAAEEAHKYLQKRTLAL